MDINWNAITAIATTIIALATVGYATLVIITLRLLKDQLNEMKRNSLFQSSLELYHSFQTSEARKARKYVHERLPKKVNGLTTEEIEKHLEGIWHAVAIFDRIGHFFKSGQLYPAEVLPIFWAIVWRCWKQSEEFIKLVRNKRRDPTYRIGFEYFFELTEEYRKENNLREPGFY